MRSIKSKLFLKLLCCSVITSSYLVFNIGCSSTVKNPNMQPINIAVFGKSYVPADVKNGQSAIVIYRQPSQNMSVPVALYIDNKYIGTVLPGGYVTGTVCIGSHSIGLAGENTLRSTPLTIKTTSTTNLETQYYEIVNGSGGIPILQSKKYIEEPSQIKKQIQTMSRLGVSECQATVPSTLTILDQLQLHNQAELNATQRANIHSKILHWQQQLIDVDTVNIETFARKDAAKLSQINEIKSFLQSALPSSTQIQVIQNDVADMNNCKYESCNADIIYFNTIGQARLAQDKTK